MRKLLIVLVATFTLMLSAPVGSYAFFGNTTNNYDNSVENKGGKGGDATAIIEDGAVKNFNTDINTNLLTNKNENEVVNVNKNDVKNFNSDINTNLVTNKNDVKNTNFVTQGQHQGQNQGQGQAQKTTVKVDSHDKYEAKRSLPGGGGAAIVGHRGPDFREKASPTANEGTVEDMLEIRKDYTLGQLVVLSGDEGDIDCDNRAYNSYRESLGHPKTGTKDMDLSLPLTLTVVRPADGMDVGLFVCEGDVDTDGVGVIAHAAIEAVRHGATVMYVSKNDFKKILNADGYTIGVGGTASAIIGDDGANAGGAVIAPRLGYGASESSYGKEPFVRGYGFR